jgi:hypothetical protein
MRENCDYIITYAYRLNEEEEIVLGKKQSSKRTEFVTWMCNNQGRNYFWGHYFDNEIDALEDLVERIKKEIR